MSAPLTPHDPPADEQPADKQPADEQPAGDSPAVLSADREELRTEARQAAVVAAAVAVAGVLLGLLWVWLAPRVPLISDGKAVYLKNSEGEQAIGADSTFVLLALGFGALSGAVVFLLRRRGGLPLVIGLAAGSLVASVIAWRVGAALGPSTDVVAAARAAGRGVVFDAPLKLAAKGALLAWPLAAMAVHLVLTALFGPRDPEPEPHWTSGEPDVQA
ncbi:ABC transporter permease [Streptomyces rectiverticillatus]|uniref:ABC transporter permease n=1 Tax=Streptomyces rectiverticillatus TaxID=173860 RepID=UPI001FE33346|nr:ABC transporter permease [Streptomyces rectiverticillatus]